MVLNRQAVEPGCPTGEQLRAFSMGQLSHELIHEIAEHLPRCRRCDQQIKRFDDCSDEMLAALRMIREHSEHRETDQANSTSLPKSGANRRPDSGQLYSAQLVDGPVRLDKFQLNSELGIGSFGHVFLADDLELGRQVAIKVQRSTQLEFGDDMQRFVREAKNAARLQHPGIVAIYESGQTADGASYLVSEYVAGETLQQKLRKGRLPVDTTVRYLIQLARALDYAHAHDVVHRDVKPSNIIIDRNEQLHLTDFGLAKSIAAEDTVTQAGQVMGTPAYMSPEQARGRSADVDARSDIYSLGVVMYQMLTGEQPFQGKNRLLLLQVLEDDPRPPSQLVSGIPRDLEVICLKAMSKLPRLRYGAADEFADDLERYQGGEPIQARPISYFERFARWCRRYPAAVVAFITLFLGSIAAMIYLSMVSHYLVHETARDSAEMQSQMLDSINEYYSGLVKEMDIHLSENAGSFPQSDLESIRPVPARFTIELGKRLQSNKEAGWLVRLYSNYPFANREDGGPPDLFGEKAIEQLEHNPSQPVYEFTELDGVPVLRFATARIMSDSCVDCHNHHRDSTKRDWMVGDVRGVLEVIRPLERDQMRTRQGMGNAITWIITMTTLLTFFVAVVVAVTTRRKNE